MKPGLYRGEAPIMAFDLRSDTNRTVIETEMVLVIRDATHEDLENVFGDEWNVNFDLGKYCVVLYEENLWLMSMRKLRPIVEEDPW